MRFIGLNAGRITGDGMSKSITTGLAAGVACCLAYNVSMRLGLGLILLLTLDRVYFETLLSIRCHKRLA